MTDTRAGLFGLGVRPLDLPAIVLVGFLPVADLSTALGSTSLRAAVLLLGAGAGLVLLGCAVARRDRPAIAMGAFALLAVAATAVARHPLPTAVGDIGASASTVLLLASVGAWGVGRWFRGRSEILEVALFVAAGLNLLVVVFDALRGLPRPPGLAGNAVFAGALFAGATAVAARRLALTRPGAAWAVGVLAMGVGIGVSGSRAALAVAVVAAPLAARSRAVLRVSAAALVIAGSLLAAPLSGDSATDRAATSGSSSFDNRFELWGRGLEATADRPLLGWGPGRYVEGAAPRLSARFAATEPSGGVAADAHNIVVEHLVTVGILGAAALLAALALSARDGRGGCRAAGLALLACHLAQPMSLIVSPTMYALLGAGLAAARPLVAPVGAARRGVVIATVALTALLSVPAAVWVATDVTLSATEGARSLTPEAERARDLAPWWRTPAARAVELGAAGARTPDDRRTVVAAADDMVDLDPVDATSLALRAELESRWGDPERAVALYERALLQAPWTAAILLDARDAAQAAGRTDLEQEYDERLCRVLPLGAGCGAG